MKFQIIKEKSKILKAMKIFILFIALLVGNGTLLAQKKTKNLDEIGKHLTGLLINRGNINESMYAINIERLFPNEDLSEFEDSPAEFIVSMLYGSQMELPVIWNELLSQADSLNISKKAEYFNTYYFQNGKDNFVLTCVLKQSSKYYAFSSIILEWENDKYVMRLYRKIKEYNDQEEVEKNLYSIIEDENIQELKEMDDFMEVEDF